MSDAAGETIASLETSLLDATVEAALVWLSGQPSTARVWGPAARAAFGRVDRRYASAMGLLRDRFAMPDDDPRLDRFAAMTADARVATLTAMSSRVGVLCTRYNEAKVLGRVVPREPVPYANPDPPKPTAVPYRRDLDGDEALAQERARMDAVLARFEAAEAPGADAGEGNGVDWALDRATRGALWLTVGPFAAHPALPPVLVLALDARRVRVPTVGLRVGSVRVSVPPSRGAAYWVDDELDATVRTWLGGRPSPWLTDDAVTAFAPAVDGPGARLTSRVLTAGARYGLLVPPRRVDAVRAAFGDGDGWEPLGDGWWTVQGVLSTEAATSRRDAWSALGFDVREASMQVRLTTLTSLGAVVGVGVARMGRVRAGEDVTVAVRAPEETRAGDARLLLRGPGVFATRALEAGAHHAVPLGALPPGRYVVRAAHARSSVASDDLLLEVFGPDPRVEVTVAVGGAAYDLSALRAQTFDLRAVFRAAGVRVRGAASGVWARWHGIDRVFLGGLSADAQGVVDLAALAPRLETLLRDDPVGELGLDLGPAGMAVIAHEGVADDEAGRVRLLADVPAARALFGDDAGPLDAWRGVWFAPVCRVLGYGVEVPPRGEGLYSEAIPDAAVWRLVQARRDSPDARCATVLVGALVALAGAFDDAGREGVARELALRACARWGCARAHLTDGLRWTVVEPGRRRAARTIDLAAACESGGLAWREALDVLAG